MLSQALLVALAGAASADMMLPRRVQDLAAPGLTVKARDTVTATNEAESKCFSAMAFWTEAPSAPFNYMDYQGCSGLPRASQRPPRAIRKLPLPGGMPTPVKCPWGGPSATVSPPFPKSPQLGPPAPILAPISRQQAQAQRLLHPPARRLVPPRPPPALAPLQLVPPTQPRRRLAPPPTPTRGRTLAIVRPALVGPPSRLLVFLVLSLSSEGVTR